MRTYYLNNSGSRWVVMDNNGQKERINVQLPDGSYTTRTAIEYRSFGNFGSVVISFKGKKLNCLMEELDNGKSGVIVSKWIS